MVHVYAGGKITHLYPQPYGPKLVLANDQMTVGLFSPLTDELTHLPGFEGSVNQVSEPGLHGSVPAGCALSLVCTPAPGPCAGLCNLQRGALSLHKGR